MIRTPAPRRLVELAIVAALLALHFALATSAVRSKSNTFDELAHLTAGYTYWRFNDYRLQPENGNWPQRLAGLIAAARGAHFPALDAPAWRRSDVYALGYQFFFESGNDADRLLWRGRATIALFGVSLAAIVFVWSRRLHGAPGAWISLVLAALSPTMLAHGALATSDMAAALSFIASTGAFWMLLHRVTPLRIAAGGIAVSAVCLSKFSAPILIPIAACMVAVRLAAGTPLPIRLAGRAAAEVITRGRQLAVFAVLGIVHVAFAAAIVWASYGFRYAAFHQPDDDATLFVDWTTVLSKPDGATPSAAGRIVDWARSHRLLPEAYLYGLAHSVKFSQSRRAFMNGEHSLTGWRTFFPYAFAVKTSIPLVVMLALAVAGVVSSNEPRARRFYRYSPLLALLSVYWLFAIAANLNIGHRHLLPTYPALFILAGATGRWLSFNRRSFERQESNRVRRDRQRGRRHGAADGRPTGRAGAVVAGTVGVLLAWHAVEAARAWPHYLAYFNAFAGGSSQGYRRLVDSSLDWGQDLPGLKAWLDERGLQSPGHSPVYLSYFGSSSPRYYGIDAVPLLGYFDRRETRLPPPLTGGWYCVSATMLQAVYLDPMGEWTPIRESQYQELLGPAQAFLTALWSNDDVRLTAVVGSTSQQFWHDLMARFDRLRTARLMAFLRRRTPAAAIGHSILLFHLTDDEAAAVVTGPFLF